jgi:hypothetical protein
MKAPGRPPAGRALLLASVLFACAPNVGGGPGSTGEGGSSASGTGGTSSSGGATGTGGTNGTGGTSASGGSTGSGGAPATGGVSGSGGTVATGGATGKGGATGTGGTSAAGGTTGSGGTPATGGATGTGGTGSGGTTATGGGTGSGGATDAGGTTSGPIDLTGRTALFVVSSPTSLSTGETILMEVLQERGLVVTAGASTGPASLAAGMNVVVVSDSASASDFVPIFGSVAVPMIVLGNSAYATLGWTAKSGAKGTVASTSMITTTSTVTPLASDLGAGTSFTAILPTTSTSLYWGTPGGAAIAVVAVMGAPTELVDFAFEKGAATATGTAPARRVGLGFHTGSIQDLTIDAFKLLSAAVDWTAGS